MNGPPTGRTNGLLTVGTLTSSQLTGSLAGKTIDNLVNLIRSGDAYLIHATQNQNGEVRESAIMTSDIIRVQKKGKETFSSEK